MGKTVSVNNYVVYKHTTPDGKVYVGATRNIGSRFGTNGSGYSKQPFGTAIRKFGWDSISHEIIACGLSKQEAEIEEARQIEQYDSANPEHGYNVLKYGIYCNDGKLSGAAYQRICEMNRSAEHIAACAKASARRRGTKRKRETVEAIVNTKKQNGSFGKACVCYETGEIFDTIADASRGKGINQACISDACNGRSATAGGLHWCFLENVSSFSPKTGVRPVTRRVTNKESGEIFQSGKDAAKAYGVTPAAINYALKHPQARCAKCHWEYTDGEWEERQGGDELCRLEESGGDSPKGHR